MKTQLQIAIEEHQSGQILKAQGLYEQLLDDEPENSDALHLLGVTFFQTGQADVAVQHIAPEEMRFLDTRGIPHFESDLTSFAQTAALIDQMDVVISVDTSVAHLAAALGKPTWLLLAHQADFRWLLGRRDSPWYPTILQFRQPSEGDWTGLLAQLQQHINMYFDVTAKIEYRFISPRTWKPPYGIN